MSNVGTELAYILPFEDLAVFPGLFGQLDQKLPSLSLTSYGVSVTTLEDVFLKVRLHLVNLVLSQPCVHHESFKPAKLSTLPSPQVGHQEDGTDDAHDDNDNTQLLAPKKEFHRVRHCSVNSSKPPHFQSWETPVPSLLNMA